MTDQLSRATAERLIEAMVKAAPIAIKICEPLRDLDLATQRVALAQAVASAALAENDGDEKLADEWIDIFGGVAKAMVPALAEAKRRENDVRG